MAVIDSYLKGRGHLFRAAVEEAWLSEVLKSHRFVAYKFFEMLCTILFSDLLEFEKGWDGGVQSTQDVDKVINPITSIVNTAMESWPDSYLTKHFCTPSFVVDAAKLLQSPIQEERALVTEMLCRSLKSLEEHERSPLKESVESLEKHEKPLLEEYAETVLRQIGMALYDATEFPGEISKRPLKHSFDLYNCCKARVAPSLLVKFVKTYLIPFLRKLHWVEFQASVTTLLIMTLNHLHRVANDCYSLRHTNANLECHTFMVIGLVVAKSITKDGYREKFIISTALLTFQTKVTILSVFKDYYPKASPSISAMRLPSYSVFFTGFVDWILNEDLADSRVHKSVYNCWKEMIDTQTVNIAWELTRVPIDHINSVNAKLGIIDLPPDSSSNEEFESNDTSDNASSNNDKSLGSNDPGLI
ncbi:hypothetical protein PSACC_01869 [Paramicrosporidium saccamoebae]|uniref:Uncharacterized protein n=1 Tax=Paramicrosporidium saccamoebae TaxID=1246581 RepID=A0A2H9TKP5_9FUNG|nr:hypothetical protein PSACC_01869 [Paramicrosporidium saccamoebae]